MARLAGSGSHYRLAVLDADGNATDNVYEFPSVTSILDSVLAKPALLRWYYSEAISGVSVLQSKYGQALPGDAASIKQLLKDEGLTPWSKRDTAAEHGRGVHDVLESLAKGGRPKRDADNAGVIDWWKDNKLTKSRILAAEDVLVSFTHRYAGTMDLVYRDLSAGVVLSDLKTSGGIYHSHLLQVAAYKLAWEEQGNEPIDRVDILHVPKKRPDSYSVFTFSESDIAEAERTWLSVLRVYNGLPKKFKPEVLTSSDIRGTVVE